jgi:hypothetical protein
MLVNECINCRDKISQLEEKENKLRIFKNNLYEIKNKILDSSNMINVYVDYKNENLNLKHEIDILRKKLADGGNSQQAYDVRFILYR